MMSAVIVRLTDLYFILSYPSSVLSKRQLLLYCLINFRFHQ